MSLNIVDSLTTLDVDSFTVWLKSGPLSNISNALILASTNQTFSVTGPEFRFNFGSGQNGSPMLGRVKKTVSMSNLAALSSYS